MTRQEHLYFCKQCTNRKFDSQRGIICGITSEIAAFEKSCEHFNQDTEVKLESESQETSYVEMLSELPDISLKNLRAHQDISYAIIGGLLAAVVSGILWAIITVTFEYQISYMAIGVGLLVGFTVRFFGAGIDQLFGYIGAFFALLGCLIGNLFSQIAFVALSDSLDYFELISLLNLDIVIGIFEETFSPIDLLFYGFAIFSGYKFAFRQIEEKFLQKDVPEDLFKPSFAKFRLPLAFVCLVFFTFILYNVKQAGNGYKTFYYSSGIKKSEGEFVKNKEQGKWLYYAEDGFLNSEGYFNNGLADSVWKWNDEKNNVIRTGSYKSGLFHGVWINFFPNGNKSDSGSYLSGRKEGEWVYYYENGKILKKGTYKRDQMVGQWQFFYDNGILSSQGNYENGENSGLWKSWFNTGNLHEEIEYAANRGEKYKNAWDFNNKQTLIDGNGTYNSYYTNGKIHQTGKVENSIREGLWITFYESGNKKEEGLYEEKYMIFSSWDIEGNANVINGEGTYYNYDEQGDIVESGQIKNGLRSGIWEVFYPNTGSIFMELHYENGKLEGPYLSYYENGLFYVEGNMKADLNDGIWNWYYDTGIIQSSVNFKNSKKVGTQSFYSEGGEKIKIELYNDGEFIGEEILNL